MLIAYWTGLLKLNANQGNLMVVLLIDIVGFGYLYGSFILDGILLNFLCRSCTWCTKNVNKYIAKQLKHYTVKIVSTWLVFVSFYKSGSLKIYNIINY